MKLQERVEGKLFIVSLLICLLASMVTLLFVLSTEEDRLIQSKQDRLKQTTREHSFLISQQIRERELQGNNAGESMESALASLQESPPLEFSENPDGSKIRTSATLRSGFYLPQNIRITPELSSKIARAERALDLSTAALLPDFNNLILITTDNIYAASPPSLVREVPPNFDPVSHPHMIAAQNSYQAFWTPVRYDPDNNRSWLTTLVIPLHQDGRFIGMLSSDFRLDRIFSDIGTLYSQQEGGAFIIQDSDTILAHPLIDTHIGKNKGVYDNASASELEDVNFVEITQAQEQLESQLEPDGVVEHIIKYSNNDIEHYAFVLPIGIKDWNWKLAAFTNRHDIDSYVSSVRWKALSATVPLALLFMFLIREVFRRLFIKRIVALEKATRNYSKTQQFVIPNPGKDEIGQLSFSFQQLIRSLEEGKTQLSEQAMELEREMLERRTAVESLEESEDKFKTLFENSPDAIILLDEKTCIDCNAAAVHLLNFPDKEKLLANTIADSAPTFQPDGQASAEKWETLVKHAHTYGKYNFEWVAQTQDNETIWIDVMLTAIPYEGDKILYAVMRNISDRKRQEVERVRLTTAIEQAAEAIMVTDTSGIVLYVNPAFLELNQYKRDDIVGENAEILYGDNPDTEPINNILGSVFRGEIWKGRLNYRKSGNTEYQAESTISPVRDATGTIMNFVYVSRDVTKEASLEMQLRQAQKMEAIGELASGIAHEINTPTQYIGDNIRFFRDSFGEITELLNRFKGFLKSSENGTDLQEERKEIEAIIDDMDLEFLEEEIPTAIEQSLDGNKRVAEIVRAMKEFAHPGAEERSAIDVNHSIRNTMSVARNEWKYVADVETDLEDDLPLVPCFPGSFNQVILNLFVNAAHAIGDVVKDGSDGKGKITVTTREDNGWVEIRLGDTGCGIPEANRTKIFDPFFTTKEVGKGTGQGLSIAHSVIVEKHGGTIDFESEIGKGTTFIIRVPLEYEPEKAQ